MFDKNCFLIYFYLNLVSTKQKNMKKFTLSIAAIIMIILGVSKTAEAQKISFGLNFGGAFPMGAFGAAPVNDINHGNFIGTAGGGFSFGLHGRYHVNDNIAVGLNVGYSIFAAQSFPNQSSSVVGAFAVLPMMAAFDYYFMTDEIKPYAGLELGIISTSVVYTDGSQTISASGSGVAFAPVVGCRFDLTEHFGLMANIKYMYGMNEHKFDLTTAANNANFDVGIPSTGYLGVNVGVNFTFGRN